MTMPMNPYTIPVTLALTVALGLAVCACTPTRADNAAEPTSPDYTAMTANELAEYLIFEDEGFFLDQKTQEGGTVRDRQTQDEIQSICSVTGQTARGALQGQDTVRVMNAARESFTYPEGGIKLGDWEKGAQIARSGYGWRVGHKTDDHSEREPGGNCYACHQMDPDAVAYGNLGPSLKGYGKARGTSEAILKYTYEVIYNPHAYFVCTQMPRFGANEVLTDQQIADVMAYLLDPESPVNQ